KGDAIDRAGVGAGQGPGGLVLDRQGPEQRILGGASAALDLALERGARLHGESVYAGPASEVFDGNEIDGVQLAAIGAGKAPGVGRVGPDQRILVAAAAVKRSADRAGIGHGECVLVASAGEVFDSNEIG